MRTDLGLDLVAGATGAFLQLAELLVFLALGIGQIVVREVCLFLLQLVHFPLIVNLLRYWRFDDAGVSAVVKLRP